MTTGVTHLICKKEAALKPEIEAAFLKRASARSTEQVAEERTSAGSLPAAVSELLLAPCPVGRPGNTQGPQCTCLLRGQPGGQVSSYSQVAQYQGRGQGQPRRACLSAPAQSQVGSKVAYLTP